jgi:dTDP-4-amino-4,6-dideoxygalactose transaminase
MSSLSVPFHRPVNELGTGLQAMNSAYLNGHGSHGPEVEEFEEALADYFGVSAELVVCTASCTDALTISQFALGSKHVAVPALTWNAAPNSVINAGGELDFIAVDDVGLMQNVLVSSNDDTIMYTQLYGQRGSFDSQHIMQHQKLIVDAAQAFEVRQLAHADATCYSFHSLKSVPLGVGGAAVFKMEAYAWEARLFRFHGVPQDGKNRAQLTNRGFKATMPAAAAAMGSALLPCVPHWLARRKDIYAQYADACEGKVDYIPQDYKEDGFHAFIVLPENRQKFQKKLLKYGVPTVRMYQALTAQPIWRDDEYESSNWMGERVTALPFCAGLTDDDVARVVKALKEAV